MDATIAAVATAAGPGGVGVLRVSGPDALEACLPLASRVPPSPTPRHAYLTPLTDRAGEVLDEGLFLFFRAPASFTGEDVVELHAHGSPAVLQLLLRAVLADGRVRLATPGEFTRRAFLHGKMDLTRAEAVADLIAADSEVAVRAAAAQARGALSARVAEVLEPLRALHADLEAALNFPDEADGAEADAAARLEALREAAEALLAGAARGRLVRRGAAVALFGPPNAGKSTLFNALLGEARALVDPEPGTTRDVLEARLLLEGLAVTLLDTAGLREAPGRVERLGVERARAALATADLAVLVLPEGAPVSELEAWRSEAGGVPLLHVRSKADLVPEVGAGVPGAVVSGAVESLRVSGVTGEGVEALRARMKERLVGEDVAGAVLVTSERHADALRRCVEALARAAQALEASTLEAVAGEVGLAHEALGEVTGESASQALLDALFARFCIGK